ncbi:MAG: hypothetical protein R3B82_15730 [Sandaracinaceae bacterium]
MSTEPTGTQPVVGHAYPADLCRLVLARWDAGEPASPGLDPVVFERFLSTAYQASLLREEERVVRFRAILTEPGSIGIDERPPERAQRFELAAPRPFTPTELRRLAVAADERRTLLGVHPDAHGELRIWGLVASGTFWLRDIEGGRRGGAPLPDAAVVLVDGPGCLTVCRGHRLVARLHAGRISERRADPFDSRWLPERFRDFRHGLLARHLERARQAREERGEVWAPLEAELPRQVAERLMKRVVSMLRGARHGATVAFVPVEHARALASESSPIDLKHGLAHEATRMSFASLMGDILDRFAQIHAAEDGEPRVVGWSDFEVATDHALATLDEALFEAAHLTAGLASVDGAVVLSMQHELLGFGGMIAGALPDVPVVWRALDLEGDQLVEESADRVGARHRSAYRLVGAVAGAIAIVISQDGSVRFVAEKSGRVVYWELD